MRRWRLDLWLVRGPFRPAPDAMIDILPIGDELASRICAQSATLLVLRAIFVSPWGANGVLAPHLLWKHSRGEPAASVRAAPRRLRRWLSRRPQSLLVVFPIAVWRAMFIVGALPALLVV